MTMPRLSDDQRQLLSFLPDDGTAIGGYSLFAQLQEAGWRTKAIERTIDELRELGELIVGRGGNGGSIRHVRKDRRALLDAIVEFEAESLACTRQSLQQYMRWRPDYLEQVLEALCEADKIRIGPGGGGGVITLVEEDELADGDEEAEVVDDPAEDERRFLALVPSTGAISNTRLRTELARRHVWDDGRYWETRQRLRQKGLIEVGRGRGGSVRRISIDNVISTSAPAQEADQPIPEELQDENDVWQRVPDNGDLVDLRDLQAGLRWPPDRFFGTLERLATTHRIHWSNSKIKRLAPTAITLTPEVPRPPAAAPTVDATTALYGFFRDRFDSGSLQRFIELHLCAPTITYGVAWNVEFADIAFRVVAALRRENYIDHELFDKLRSYFPKLHPQINALAQLWAPPPA